ncbi:hypothetical protein SADUNF_Sadunf10G0158000 [Salix dunnii]|uniref:3-oxo-5-alpha-steroid 4-dehydrogenase C-terminal domain-containing protein n=1 Tax=Salix dunnii TaxID=1413687 RepID=A0A835MQ31_9ROSI|nr:hypothetical protein SADUNF_Sadunf10G0158000 [Salix dunnii]
MCFDLSASLKQCKEWVIVVDVVREGLREEQSGLFVAYRYGCRGHEIGGRMSWLRHGKGIVAAVSYPVTALTTILSNSQGLLFLSFGELGLSHLFSKMKVTVVSRSGREVIKGGLELSDSATVADLQKAIHKRSRFLILLLSFCEMIETLVLNNYRDLSTKSMNFDAFFEIFVPLLQFRFLELACCFLLLYGCVRTRKFYPSRQRLTLPLPSGSKERPVVLSYKKNLKDYCDGNSDSLTVVFKDLGPQVSYRTLFFCEYLGPLVLYPVFYYFPVYEFFGYKGERIIHPVQTYALYYWCFHYFKRIMETFFVHRFSHATSPLSNVFRNCAYYWTFGSLIAYYVNHPRYTPVNDLQMKIGFGFGLVCQLANFYCHILLRSLRRPGGNGGYQIPSGFLFNIVTCANYTTEIYQWLGFNVATQTVTGYIFLVVATSIMTNWALAKHRRLKKAYLGLLWQYDLIGISYSDDRALVQRKVECTFSSNSRRS